MTDAEILKTLQAMRDGMKPNLTAGQIHTFNSLMLEIADRLHKFGIVKELCK